MMEYDDIIVTRKMIQSGGVGKTESHKRLTKKLPDGSNYIAVSNKICRWLYQSVLSEIRLCNSITNSTTGNNNKDTLNKINEQVVENSTSDNNNYEN